MNASPFNPPFSPAVLALALAILSIAIALATLAAPS